jgi:hypothetical protein
MTIKGDVLNRWVPSGKYMSEYDRIFKKKEHDEEEQEQEQAVLTSTHTDVNTPPTH